MTTRIAFGVGRSIWTALVRGKTERSLLYAKPRSPLNVDDGAGYAGLAVQHVQRAGVAESKQGAGCVKLWIVRAVYEELAVEKNRVRAVAERMQSGCSVGLASCCYCSGLDTAGIEGASTGRAFGASAWFSSVVVGDCSRGESLIPVIPHA